MTQVHLMGAGPGDPELITVKAQRLLASADVVLYDALANPALLALAPKTADCIYVGKRARGHSVSQAEIGDWMVERARRGQTVVRLKGGDPAVFARLGEETAALRAAGIAYKIIPGVTAASAAAAALGVPLTLRRRAPGVRFLTGAEVERHPPAPARDTLAVYMGMAGLAAIAAALLRAGWPPRTPAAVVGRASLPGECRCQATLAKIAALAAQEDIPAPALILVGTVVCARPPAALAATVSVAKRAAVPPGLILMAHGSPLASWQRDARAVARALAVPGQFTAAAFLPPVRPSLDQAVARAAARGVERLAIVPYFLAPGLHVQRDIPQLVAAARARFPQLDIRLTLCLAGHPALRTAALSRATEAFAV